MAEPIRINVVTLFPEVFGPWLDASIIGRARAEGRVEFRRVQLRDFTHDRHHTVDDRSSRFISDIPVRKPRSAGGQQQI